MASDDAEFARCARRLAAVPADGRAAADLARCAADNGREGEALPLVARAATQVAASAVLHQWVGVLARAVGDSDTAFTHFSAAARIAPTDARIAQGCALSALEAGWPAAALFERALALDPLHETALLGRAAARVADGELPRAIAELDAVLAVNPGWLTGHQRSAQLRWMAGDRVGFTASLDRALAGTPGDPALWLALLALLTHAEAYPQLLAAAGRANAAAGPHAGFALAEATARSELGDAAGADRVFDAGPGTDAGWGLRRVRHDVRTDRADRAAARLEPWLTGPAAAGFWPYAATCWRLTGDPRYAWLEGDRELVREVDLELDLAAVAAVLRSLHERKVHYFEQSVRGGTQTDGPLFARVDPVLLTVRRACARAVGDYLAALPPVEPGHPFLGVRRDRPVGFAGSWSVRLTDGGYHTAHVHPEGWISSALYIAVPDTADGAGWLDLGAPPTELGLDLPPVRSVRPRPGRLILFPSTMWHGTRAFAAGERLSIAFDIAPPPAR